VGQVGRDGTRKVRPWSPSLEGHAHRLDSYNAVTEETLELERIEQWHRALPYVTVREPQELT
jgi:hypothetical protein